MKNIKKGLIQLLGKNKQQITIRGHHLKNLYQTLQEGEIIKDSEYGRWFKIQEKSIYESLIKNPKRKIKINSELDDLCSYCPLKKETCTNSDSRENDKMYLKYAGLKPDKTYSASEIISSLKKPKFKELMGILNELYFRTTFSKKTE